MNNKGFYSIKKILMAMLLSALIIQPFFAVSVSATGLAPATSGSWVPSIPPQHDTDGAVVSRDTNTVDQDFDVNSGKVSWLDRTIGHIFTKSGNSIEGALAANGYTIEKIVLGRVARGNETQANDYHFYLTQGNTFGYVAALVYRVFRALMVGFLLLYFMFELAKSGLAVSGQAKQEFKAFVPQYILMFFLLYLMPNVVDLIIYLRDTAMKTIVTILYKGDGLSITDAMYNTWKNEPSTINGFLYLASVGLVIYYLAMYVGNAFVVAVLFAFFPLVALMTLKDKNLLTGWLKQVIGTLITPLIDGSLLVIPILTLKSALDKFGDAQVVGKVGILLVVITEVMAIIPGRGIIRTMIGLGDGGAGEKFGFNGISGAMNFAKGAAGVARGMGSIAAAAGKGASSIGDAVSEARKDKADAMNRESGEADKARSTESGKNANGVNHDIGNNDNKALEDKSKDTSSRGFDSEGDSSVNDNDKDNKTDSEPIISPRPNPDNTEDEFNRPNSPYQSGENGNDSQGVSSGGSEAEAPTPPSGTSDAGPGNPPPPNDPVEFDNTREGNLKMMEQAENAIKQDEINLGELDKADAQATMEAQKAREDLTTHYNKDVAALDQRYKDEGKMDEKGDISDKATKNEYLTERGNLETAYRTKNDNISRQLNATKDANNDERQKIKSDITAQRNTLSDARDREQAYASQDKMMGGTGQTFKSASEFNNMKAINDVARRQANHKNYTDKGIYEALTPQERARYAREHSQYVGRKNAANITKAVGSATGDVLRATGEAGGEVVGAMGSVMLMAGGPEMMQQAQQTGHAVGKAAATTGEAVGNTVEAVGSVASAHNEKKDLKVERARSKAIKNPTQKNVNKIVSKNSTPIKPREVASAAMGKAINVADKAGAEKISNRMSQSKAVFDNETKNRKAENEDYKNLWNNNGPVFNPEQPMNLHKDSPKTATVTPSDFSDKEKNHYKDKLAQSVKAQNTINRWDENAH